jgi:hypothetical protein
VQAAAVSGGDGEVRDGAGGVDSGVSGALDGSGVGGRGGGGNEGGGSDRAAWLCAIGCAAAAAPPARRWQARHATGHSVIMYGALSSHSPYEAQMAHSGTVSAHVSGCGGVARRVVCCAQAAAPPPAPAPPSPLFMRRRGASDVPLDGPYTRSELYASLCAFDSRHIFS